MPLAERRRLLELAAHYQVPVVEDAIYARLRVRGNAVPSLKMLDRAGNVIQIDSFSKTAFPGLRVGWCIGAESAIERLRLVKQSTDLHTDQLSQAAMAEFMRRGYFAKHLAKMRKMYRSRLAAMEDALEKHMPDGTSWTHPEGGMALWVTLPPGFDAGELLIHARERGILFLPGRYFYSQQPGRILCVWVLPPWTRNESRRESKSWRSCWRPSFASGSAALETSSARAWR